jgi:hypothetical protein
MSFKLLRLATVALLACYSFDVSADQTFKQTVKAGQKARVWWSGQIDIGTCKTIDTINNRPDIVREPANGSLVMAIEQRPFKSAAGTSPCDGKPFSSNVVYYQSKPGFKGVDTFIVRRSVWMHYREMTEMATVELTVQ